MGFNILGNIAHGVGWIVGEAASDIAGGFGYIGREFGEGLGLEGRGPSVNVNTPSPVDYSEASSYLSDNNKIVGLAQVQAQELALQQASLDREMQLAANLELGIEKLDTRLQTARLEFTQQMTAEENRHIEKAAELRVLQEGREASRARPAVDIPDPTSFFEEI